MARNSVPLDGGTVAFLGSLRLRLAQQRPIGEENTTHGLFQGLLQVLCSAQSCWGFAVTLYQPGLDRLMVVRAAQSTAFENVRQVMRQIPKHARFQEFDLTDWNRCRMQVDFIVDAPQPVALAEFSDSVLPAERVASGHRESDGVTAGLPTAGEARHAERDGYFAAWQIQVENWTLPKHRTRFELGVDGLRIVKEGKRRYFLPGDAFVHSILGIAQLKRHI
ncbi:MAG: hypothetical protein O3C40_34235 [Planctomycetota bacterium]|nr:hypothetical protein [Planctomycetota bacterium]